MAYGPQHDNCRKQAIALIDLSMSVKAIYQQLSS
jgi:hypothetical protein